MTHCMNRSAAYGFGSQNGVAPVISSAMRRPVAGPSVRPQWPWPQASQRPRWRGAGAITGRESGKQGRAPSQGCASTGSPSGNSSRAAGMTRASWTGVGRRIAGGEFGAGGDADPLLHRRQAVAAFRVEYRAAEHGVPLRAEMAMVAALDRERQLDAERREHVRRPRPERDHDVAGVERPGGGIDAPMRSGAVQRARVAGKRNPAERGEARRVGARQRQADW